MESKVFIVNILRTMGPSFEHVVKISVLSKDVDDLSKLSTEERECLYCNHHVIDLLFEYMDRELSDSIQEERLLQKTCSNAYRLWKFLEKIYEDDSDDEDQEEEQEEPQEEYSTATINTHPLVTSSDVQEARSKMFAGFLLEPVRPVLPGGSAKKARNAPVGDQDKLQLGQHPHVMLITNA